MSDTIRKFNGSSAISSLNPPPSPRPASAIRPVARPILATWLALAFVCIFSATHAAGEGDTPSWVTKICNQSAAGLYYLAWPTATYRAWQFRGIVPRSGALELTIRLYGQSGWDDSLLYTDVVFTVTREGLQDLHWGYNNADLFPPGTTMSIMANAFQELQRQFQLSQSARAQAVTRDASDDPITGPNLQRGARSAD